jgi:hypothetical protein
MPIEPVNPQPRSFGEKADAFLTELYHSVGATNTTQKLNVLRLKLGGDYHFYAMGGEINDEVKVACLEYELLGREGLIELVLA